jgi:hypothetical protein
MPPAPGSDTEVSMEIFDDPNFAENISSEIEEFLAVGEVPYNSQGIPVADAGNGGAGCSTVPYSQMFGGGGCDGGCGPGCGSAGGGFYGSFGFNPTFGFSSGPWNVNASVFGQGNGNNVVGVTIPY